LICQKNSAKVYTGWRESLRDHLQTKAHIEFTPKEDRKNLSDSIVTLGGNALVFEDEIFEEVKDQDILSMEKERELIFKVVQFLIKNHLPFSAADDFF